MRMAFRSISVPSKSNSLISPKNPSLSARAVARVLRSRQCRRAAAFLEPDLLARYAPVHVALEQEVARRKEQVDLIEVRPDEPLAEEEVLLGAFGEALGAATRRGLQAKRLVHGSHESAVTVADGHVVVQRVDDRRRGQHAADQGDQLAAHEQRVLKVHDVGVLRAQEVGEEPRVQRLLPIGHVEEVEPALLDPHEVLARVTVEGAERASGSMALGARAADQNRLQPFRLEHGLM